MIDILSYFEMKAKGDQIPDDYLGDFSKVIPIVEEYISPISVKSKAI